HRRGAPGAAGRAAADARTTGGSVSPTGRLPFGARAAAAAVPEVPPGRARRRGPGPWGALARDGAVRRRAGADPEGLPAAPAVAGDRARGGAAPRGRIARLDLR